MNSNFPQGWKCPPEIRDLYPEVERDLLPIIRHKAKRLRRYMDVEDAVQEGRLALLSSMLRYDSNRGKLEAFVSTVLDNTFNAMFYACVAQCRMPRAVARGDDGEWITMKQAPVSIDSLLGFDPVDEASDDPEEAAQRGQMEELAKVFRLKMINLLEGRDLDVFNAKVNPPVELLIMIRNMGEDWTKPRNTHIAKFLGIDKNAVDCSLSKIRVLFTKLAKSAEFNELYGEHVAGKDWPVIHLSESTSKHDVEFISATIKARGLDPKPTTGCHAADDYIAKSGSDFRLVERYDWGAVVVLKFGDEWRTLVVEGKFNPRTGFVIGDNSAQERIPVEWYPQLLKKLGRTM